MKPILPCCFYTTVLHATSSSSFRIMLLHIISSLHVYICATRVVISTCRLKKKEIESRYRNGVFACLSSLLLCLPSTVVFIFDYGRWPSIGGKTLVQTEAFPPMAWSFPWPFMHKPSPFHMSPPPHPQEYIYNSRPPPSPEYVYRSPPPSPIYKSPPPPLYIYKCPPPPPPPVYIYNSPPPPIYKSPPQSPPPSPSYTYISLLHHQFINHHLHRYTFTSPPHRHIRLYTSLHHHHHMFTSRRYINTNLHLLLYRSTTTSLLHLHLQGCTNARLLLPHLMYTSTNRHLHLLCTTTSLLPLPSMPTTIVNRVVFFASRNINNID